MMRGMRNASSEAAKLRTFPARLGLKGTDVGEGWLIFDPPEADLGVRNRRNAPSGAAIFPSIATTSPDRIGAAGARRRIH